MRKKGRKGEEEEKSAGERVDVEGHKKLIDSGHTLFSSLLVFYC